jgi:hypothetical protein
MDDHTTDRTIYVLAALSLLLFVISLWYESNANRDRQPLQTFEPPKISADQRPG